MRPFRSSDDGSLYSLTAIYFLMSLCGAMTSLSISLHFAALHKGELLVASIFVSGACAQVFVVPLLSPLFNKFSSYRIAIFVLLLDLLGLLAMAAYPEPLILIFGNLVTACLSGLSIPAIFTIVDSQVSGGRQAKLSPSWIRHALAADSSAHCWEVCFLTKETCRQHSSLKRAP